MNNLNLFSWFNAKTQIPFADEWVVVVMGSNRIKAAIAHHCDEGWYSDKNKRLNNVKYWIHIPKSEEELKNNIYGKIR